tara:strand:- start:4959 stop:5555 length:597 start_codon:yes stop_codon:yes gene_type:complete
MNLDTEIEYSENYINNVISSEIKNSQKRYDSTMAPFFRPYEDDNIDDIKSESIIPETDFTNIDSINNFSHLCDNKDIQDFFINNNGIDREIYIKEWIFFSIEKVLSLDEMYKLSNINNIVDLGYIYHGMGWVIVAFYYIPNKNIYFRMDGGSNGYDRMENFNRLKNIDKLLESNENGINFSQFLNKIENDFYVSNIIV